MSMVNSESVDWIIGEQVKGSLITKKLGLEPISMGYIIVEPGMKVGEVGRAVPIKRDDLKGAMSYALACEYLGMSFVYLEAGSGADRPVPPAMIKAVKEILSVPLIVGGGIRTPEAAEAARLAGADAIVTGTFVERCSDDSELKNVIRASKG
jgi:phosphoglycerol geranylgeranyltransferase